MSIIFSKKCEYGIQAVLYLSSLNNSKVVNAEEISGKLQIPKEFVSKILQELTASGMVSSKKGKNGGFMLAKPLSEIKLIDVVSAIDGLSIFHSCVLGFPNCSDSTPCPVHHKWAQLIKDAYAMISEETLDTFTDATFRKIQSINQP